MGSFDEYLEHYGVLGMKWGVRRYQNYDGSLTPAGRKHYDVNVESKRQELKNRKKEKQEAYKEYNKATLGGMLYDKKAANNYVKSEIREKYAKDDLKSEKVKEKLNAETKITKRRADLINNYKSRGMSEDEAEIAAYKREKTEKMLKIVGGMTVAAIAGYAAYKYHGKVTDKILKSGMTLQNIANDSNNGVRDAFYASFKKSDMIKYKGVYGSQIKSMGGTPFSKTVKLSTDIKMASEKSAKKVFTDLINSDQEMKKAVSDILLTHPALHGGGTEKQTILFQKAYSDLRNGKITNKVYDAFNISLPWYNNPDVIKSRTKFYDALSKSGYNAILDVNDKKYSGYYSKNPIIMFNANSKINIDSVKQVGASELSKAKDAGWMNIYLNTIVRDAGPKMAVGAIASGSLTATISAIQSKTNDKIVQEYRKKHPNTELSYTEIVRMETLKRYDS